MRVYVDTGPLIDYLAQAAAGAAILRTAPRRGRSPSALFREAEHVLNRVRASHEGATSALTFYEVEEALFKGIAASTRGLRNAAALRVAIVRPIVTQALLAADRFGLTLLPVDEQIVRSLAADLTLRRSAVRAADALHVRCAARFDAELLITTDAGLLALDGRIVNGRGDPIRCRDTHDAAAVL